MWIVWVGIPAVVLIGGGVTAGILLKKRKAKARRSWRTTMKISDLLSMCLRSLLRRKVRTLLTVIGVVIGTCAIVVTISLGEG